MPTHKAKRRYSPNNNYRAGKKLGIVIQSTIVFLPGNSMGEEPGMLYSPWGSEESDTTERLRIDRLLQRLEVKFTSSGGTGSIEKILAIHPRGAKMGYSEIPYYANLYSLSR